MKNGNCDIIAMETFLDNYDGKWMKEGLQVKVQECCQIGKETNFLILSFLTSNLSLF